LEKLKVSNGIFWVEIPEADLRILCGCPADSVKHLMKRGLVSQRSKDGVSFETGPNAILLCDTPMQKGCFTNLSEFPVLQMLYRQGMIIPGHPNNTGRKPMLLGLEDQVRSQSQYIFRGNYGLASEEELTSSGVPVELAREMMRIKKWFAFGRIRDTEELLDLRVVTTSALEIAPGVVVHHKGINRWEFFCGGQSLDVDLSLGEGEEYEAPYDLGSRTIRGEYFSVIHMGEGDGWDTAKPCMGSILCFQGRLYLIDAGPNIMHSLTALCISMNEIEGIFHTHCHDDHFAGLTSLVRSDRRLRYFAVPCVRASVEKKLSALMGIEPRRFAQLFDVHDLVPEEWNTVEGLDVRPSYSPHPVETTVFFFRAMGAEGERTYAHLADLPSFEVLGQMVTEDPLGNGMSAAARDRFVQNVTQPLEVKKVDAGGGLIHGRAEDFAGDTSAKIILSHTGIPFTESQKEIGSSAAFGQIDVLIPVQHQSFVLRSAHRFLMSSFPEVPREELGMLLNCRIVTFNAGSLMIKKGMRNTDIFLLLTGTAEVIDRDAGFHNRIAAGALAGELSALADEPSPRTFRAESAIAALRIPCTLYRQFIRRNALEESVHRIRENRKLLFNTRLFGEMASFTFHRDIARLMERRDVVRGQHARHDGDLSLFLLAQGEIALRSGGTFIETIFPGDCWGEIAVTEGLASTCDALAIRDSVFFAIPAKALVQYPSLQLKLQEEFNRRMKLLRTNFNFDWQDSYSVGVQQVDDQRRELFRLINEIAGWSGSTLDAAAWHGRLERLIGQVRSHFAAEESMLATRGYPRLAEHRENHGRLIAELEELARSGEGALALGKPVDPALKDWLIRHTLIEDRLQQDFFVQKRRRADHAPGS
jgi:hemerythrin